MSKIRIQITLAKVSKMELATVIREAMPGMAPTGPTGDYRTDVAIHIAEHVKKSFILARRATVHADTGNELL